MQIETLTDVRLREQWHDKGTVFVVGDDDGQVDATTAGQWVRNGWAVEVGGDASTSGAGASGAPSPPAQPDPLPPAGEGKEEP